MFDTIFTTGEVRNYRDTLRGDASKQARFNALLYERGLLKSESKHYFSTSLTDADVEQPLEAWDEALAIMARE